MVVTFLAMLLLADPCRSPGIGAELTNVSNAARKARSIPVFVTGAFVRSGGGELEPGDIVQAVGREIVQNTCDVRAALGKLPCGSKARLVVRRGADTLKLDVVVRDGPQRASASAQDRCRAGDGAGCTELARQTDDVVLLRQACDLGDGDGCFLLGVKLGNTPEGAAAYEQACDHGNPLACTNLGYMLERGEGLPRDLPGTARMYQKGCRGSLCTRSNTLGCVNLGRMHRDGIGVKTDVREALRLFRLACDRTPADAEEGEHIARACSVAGTLLLFNKELKAEPALGMSLLEKGCAGDDTFGCFNLGVIYENRNDREASRSYYKRACEHGDAEACALLQR